MQNYLQSRGKRRTRITKALIYFAIICLILAATILLQNSQDKNNDEKNVVKYVSSFTSKTFNEQSNKQEQIVQKEEMNNLQHENSNFLSQEVKNLKQGIKISSEVRVLCSDGKIRVENLEDYVLGCLLGEMPLSFESQALMAQAVAIRSFTARKTLISSKSHPGADVCTDSRCCQSYISPSQKKTDSSLFEKAKQAVNATRSVIATYEGIPIEAVYHASSGFFTLDSRDVWGGEISYLVSVKAPEKEAETTKKVIEMEYGEFSQSFSDYCDKTISCGSFGERVSVFNNEMGLTESITADKESFTASDIKRALGLPSSDFTISAKNSGVTITCYGFGHRVGLSQHGANLLAKEGKSYSEILKYYYTGINLGIII